MTSVHLPLPHYLSPADIVQRVDLRCFSHGDRSLVLDGLMQTLNQSSSWLESRRVISSSQVEIYFVAMLGAVDELYGGLLAAGLEMSSESHREMTWLCTLRRHRKDSVVAVRTVSVRLEMSFFTESAPEMGFVAAGSA
jgi:hypothetical protein